MGATKESAALPIPGTRVIEPAEVGSQVVDAVRHDRLYVFTHPERVDEARARFARITES
jgi:hypothetical protein